MRDLAIKADLKIQGPLGTLYFSNEPKGILANYEGSLKALPKVSAILRFKNFVQKYSSLSIPIYFKINNKEVALYKNGKLKILNFWFALKLFFKPRF